MSMYEIDRFWWGEPTGIKLCLLALFLLALTCFLRFVRLAFRLYFYRGQTILPERVAEAAVDPSSGLVRSCRPSILPICAWEAYQVPDL
jgi:hypothetical protein